MKKIINPCQCEVYSRNGNPYFANAFVEIEYVNGKLSLCGVIGPMSNGDCRGSAGQCANEIRKGTPTADWSAEMLFKLCDIWDKWHLNDMHPECEHQRNLGWDEQAKEKIYLYL